MDDVALRELVRELLGDGRLPKSASSSLIAKYGDGTVCDVCERPVVGSTVMYLLNFGSGDEAQQFLMHFKCFMVWDVERNASRK